MRAMTSMSISPASIGSVEKNSSTATGASIPMIGNASADLSPASRAAAPSGSGNTPSSSFVETGARSVRARPATPPLGAMSVVSTARRKFSNRCRSPTNQMSLSVRIDVVPIAR